MMGIRARSVCTISVVAFSVMAAMACDNPEPESRDSLTVGDLCVPIQEFIRVELSIPDAEARVSGDRAGLRKPLDEVKSSADCLYTDPGSPVSVDSSITMISSETVDDRKKSLADLGYDRIPGRPDEVWLRDLRAVGTKNPQTETVASIAVLYGNWEGKIDISRSDGDLDVPDDKLGKAADLLTQLTKRAADSEAN